MSAFAKDAFGNALASKVVQLASTPPKSKGGIDNIASSLDSKRLGNMANAGLNFDAGAGLEFGVSPVTQLTQSSGSAAVDAATANAVKDIVQSQATTSDDIDEIVVTGVRTQADRDWHAANFDARGNYIEVDRSIFGSTKSKPYVAPQMISMGKVLLQAGGIATLPATGAAGLARVAGPWAVSKLLQINSLGITAAEIGAGTSLTAGTGALGLKGAQVTAQYLDEAANSARPDAFAGVKEASNILRDAGVPRNARREIIQSFDLETFRVQRLDADMTAYRLFDDSNAILPGRYVSTDFFASQTDRIQNFALMKNAATRLGEVNVPQGSVVFTGKVAAQPTYSTGLTGGANQTFLVTIQHSPARAK